MGALGTTIRVFISSTFSDFQTERNVLQEHVVSEFLRMYAEAGFRPQPLDLHWGVSEEVGTEWQRCVSASTNWSAAGRSRRTATS
jgi:hypothetical protein